MKKITFLRFFVISIFTLSLFWGETAQCQQTSGKMAINGQERNPAKNPSVHQYKPEETVAAATEGILSPKVTGYHQGCDKSCFEKNFWQTGRAALRGSLIAIFSLGGISVTNEKLDDILKTEVGNMRVAYVDFHGMSGNFTCIQWSENTSEVGEVSETLGVIPMIIWNHAGKDYIALMAECLNAPRAKAIVTAIIDGKAHIVAKPTGTVPQPSAPQNAGGGGGGNDAEILAQALAGAGSITKTATKDSLGNVNVNVTVIPVMNNSSYSGGNAVLGGTQTQTITGGGSGSSDGNGFGFGGLTEIVPTGTMADLRAPASSGGVLYNNTGGSSGLALNNTTWTREDVAFMEANSAAQTKALQANNKWNAGNFTVNTINTATNLAHTIRHWNDNGGGFGFGGGGGGNVLGPLSGVTIR